MRLLAVVLVAAAAAVAMNEAAWASVVVTIDKSQQTMSVSVDGANLYSWPVSTARAGYSTPNGVYRPQFLARSWFSRKYYNSPMPHSIFFHGGYAIHGSYEISRLGGPASHGCVRLHPSNAATLFALVQREGTGNTRIVVTGASASSRVVSARVREPRPDADGFYDAPQPRWRYDPYGAYRPAPGGLWWLGQ
jgi:lipoprotein-anchoring transpeptidase ErfK/SrfK